MTNSIFRWFHLSSGNNFEGYEVITNNGEYDVLLVLQIFESHYQLRKSINTYGEELSELISDALVYR